MVYLITALLMMTGQGSPVVSSVRGSGEGRVIHAEKWFGGPSFRYPEDRSLVILFFHTSPPRDQAEAYTKALRAHVEHLNQLVSERKDVLVLGLTSEPEDRLKDFVLACKPKFALGVRSTSAKSFGVERFPSIVVLKSGVSRQEEGLTWIAECLGPPLAERPTSPSERSIEQLKEALAAASGGVAMPDEAREALESLRIRMDYGEFASLCDDLEKRNAMSPSWLGRVRYQRHLADPAVVEKQAWDTPVTAAQSLWRQSRDDPVWDPIEDFFKDFESRGVLTLEEVVQVYRAHLGDDPADLLTRIWLADTLRALDQQHLTPALRTMLDIEPDAVIRIRLMIALCALAPDGDPETLKHLEHRLDVEDNIRAKPMLEAAVRMFREGNNRSG